MAESSGKQFTSCTAKEVEMLVSEHPDFSFPHAEVCNSAPQSSFTSMASDQLLVTCQLKQMRRPRFGWESVDNFDLYGTERREPAMNKEIDDPARESVQFFELHLGL
jgi:hypothetical protein